LLFGDSYGDTDHETFLGCLNCGQSDTTSVCNEFGLFGNSISGTSIWNASSLYGNAYTPFSPWSADASYPPVIVDRNGNFYGYLTADHLFPNRTKIAVLDRLADAASRSSLKAVADKFCGR
jgi:hypothetical protein